MSIRSDNLSVNETRAILQRPISNSKQSSRIETEISSRQSPFVSVIILNWNNAADTIACLVSVFNLVYENYKVLVVDNGSTDDSVQRIKTMFSNIELLETGENLGYAEGNNIGIRHALKQKPDYILVLNNDTLVAPDLLRELVREAQDDTSIGMVGPKMYFYEPPDMIFAAGSQIDWRIGKIYQRGISQCETQFGPLYFDHAEDVDFIVGCCILVSYAVINEIGLLNSRYYLNFEDVEWCVRARRAGYQIRYVPTATLYHKVSAKLGQASPANTYYMTRNALDFFWRQAPSLAKYTSLLHILARTVRTIIAWTLKNSYRTEQYRRKRDANIFAVRDFFLGRLGRMGEDVAQVCYGS